MKALLKMLAPYADLLLLPFVYPSAWLLRNIRRAGIQRLPWCKKALLQVGVFPIRNHYYEPQFDLTEIEHSFSDERSLPGVNWTVPEQLDILERLTFSEELEDIPVEKVDDLHFYLNNRAFGPGDAEYWYQLIRMKKPKRIFEIGSGNSTLMAIDAVRKNQEENSAYECMHVCIEPYEMPWLEKTGVSVVRSKVEDVDISFFSELGEDDILFIDSSHVIRPEGDVLFEYLQLLPTLNKGVIVHVHDIFTPRNYPDKWLRDVVKFWNEQYLLEAFLSHNASWKIIGATNYLYHSHYEALKRACPYLTRDGEPSSFYIQKTA